MKHVSNPLDVLQRVSRLVVGALVALALCMAAAAAAPGTALADERSDLNDSAVDAMVAGDHDRAIKLLKASLVLGELNVTWLNLGRAYALSGRCKDALEAYDLVAVAPQVDEPPAEVIYEILTRYRNELIDSCPGNLQVRCSGANARVRVDDDAANEHVCDGQALSLDAGAHTVSLWVDGVEVDRAEVDIEGMATSYVELSSGDGSLPTATPTEMRPNELSSPLLLGGSVTAGVGGALMIGGIVTSVLLLQGEEDLETAVADEDFEAAVEIADGNDTLALTSNVLFGVGGVALAAGIAMIVTSQVLPDEAVDVSVSFGDEGGALLLRHRF